MNKRLIRQFAHPSGTIGRIAGLVMAIKNRDRIEQVTGSLQLRANASLLEIGSGPGIALSRLLRRYPALRVTAVDSSPVMIEQARNRIAAEFPDASVYWLAKPIETVAIQPFEYDCIFSINSFMFWNQPEEVLRKLHLGLKPGGTLVIAIQPRWLNNEPDFIRLLEQTFRQVRDAGFEEVHSEEFDLHSSPMFVVTATRSFN